jgi:hypothetical protein
MNQTVHELRITNVALDEGVPLIIFDVMQACRVSANAHFVNIYQFKVRVLCKQVPAEVASDKS